MRVICCFLVILALRDGVASAQGTLSPDAPPDRPVAVASDTALQRLFELTQPAVDQARATYPQAKQRFLAGLPANHLFFITTRLRDGAGRVEQVFVAVDSIAGTQLHGRLSSRIGVVTGYRYGDRLAIPEAELVDWLIAKPDGSEEGNFVGKFLDAYQRRR